MSNAVHIYHTLAPSASKQSYNWIHLSNEDLRDKGARESQDCNGKNLKFTVLTQLHCQCEVTNY